MTQLNDYLAATRTTVPDSGLYIDCRDLFKIYKRADLEVVALRGLDLSVESGELIAVIGASGSGKSTLLNILAGLDRPSAGQVLVGTRDLLDVSDSDLVMYRRSEVGFVWQATARNLVPYLSVSDNIELPMALTGLSSKSRRAWSEELLESLGMIDKAKRLPYQLSGGEQQRAAIAVGLANKPPLLLADEPTGELDTENADAIFEMIRGLNRSYGVTVVTVTHYAGVSKFVDRVVHIRDGRIGSETFSRPDYRRDGGTVEEEYVVVDAAGRLQLPHDLAERFRRGGLAKIQSDDRQITIDPPGTNPRQPRSRS
ncbi:MAG: ABC transporter ATP-binding protein [Chloroflexota bacterium]|nr:ABC transporter ATP-binding protein [Chloroflexota bacterium]MED5405116.1 ABC transporter ATP-binding protein [Chloroflexota bacterium]